MEKLSRVRIGITLLFFAFFYAVIVYRLFYWQVFMSSQLKKLSLEQSSESLIVQAQRGDILSSDNYPLSTSTKSYLFYLNPKLIRKEDREKAEKLAEILEMKKEDIEKLMSKNLYWVKIDENISEKQRSEIDALDINSTGFRERSLRYYPEASMAAHLIGFTGKDDKGEDKGYFGLEGFYNDQLIGRSGRLYLVHDALGNPILNDVREEEKINGRNLVLNIDRGVQYIVEKNLREGIKKYQAEGGSVIVMNPINGKVYAMVSFPQFNPQEYYKYSSENYKNPAISNLYEPGSTFKVLVMAAGIDAGLIKPDTVCAICSGPVTIHDYTIKTWNDKYYPNSTMIDVIQHSDNTGMVFVGKTLGVEKLTSYLTSFGISEKTGIDLEGEIAGKIRDKKEWYPIDLATAAFGQGISLTPMQLIVAVSSIANGGDIVKPQVVSEIVTENGEKIKVEVEIKRKVISENTAKIMTAMMVNAVEKGESKWTKIKNYKIAGKTGTAQIPIQGHYDPKETVASFVGFFPADNPEISMLVLINRPKTSIYGSETAAPIFFSIAKELIGYYNIQPSN